MIARAWILLTALVALSALSLACGGSDDSGTKSDDITKVADNFGKVKSFKAAIVQTGNPAGNLQGNVEFQKPDRIHVIVGSGASAQEVVCVDNDFYVKSGTAAWLRMPTANASTDCQGNLGPADPKLLSEGIKAAAADKALVKGGQESVNGSACQVYTQSLPNGATTELCITNGLPVRIVNKAGTQAVTITFSDFNKNIDIKAPI